jgi:small subunit ribosomal protein S6
VSIGTRIFCAGRAGAIKTTGGVNMRDYELLFVLDPTLDEEKKAAIVETVKSVINAGGEAGEADVWGERRLAYTINKKNTGYYVVLPFKADAELPKELDRRLRINENVMRHIIVCQDEE